MGVDINAVVEYNRYPEDPDIGYCGYAQLWLPKGYGVFGAMAGVRESDRQLFEPRGYPEDASGIGGYWKIVETPDAPSDEWKVTRREAEEAVASGKAVYRDSKQKFVSDLDAFSPSWLWPHEFRRVLDSVAPVVPVWHATADLLEGLERLMDGCPVRLVFWFYR